MAKIIYEAGTYIEQGSLGTDVDTGLERVVQYTNINIDARNKVITITWEEVLITPNGQAVGIVANGWFTRVNKVDSMKYDSLHGSAIGIGIRQMLLALDFPDHPTYEQI